MSKSPILALLCFGLLATLGTSCQSGAASPDDATTSVRPSDSDFHQLTQYFHQKADRGELAGTVILLKQKNEIWMDKYGHQDREAEVPMSYETIFRMASMTKPITSTAAMILVEREQLRLDEPVENHLPGFDQLRVLGEDGSEFPLERSITVRDLLLHTAGFTSSMFQNTPAGKAYAEAFRSYRPGSLAELVGKLAELPLAHQPGKAWTYGFSTDVLGRIVELVSEKPLDQFFQEEIFQPLGMEDTGFQVPEEKRARLAVAYGKEGQIADSAGEKSPYCNGRNYARGVGGLVSTAADYLRFCEMLLNGGIHQDARILKASTVAEMMKNHLPEGVLPHSPGMSVICNGFGFGFGVQTAETAMGHPGDCAWPGAYLTYFFIDPTHEAVGILLAQSTDFSNLPMLGEFHNMAAAVFENNFKQVTEAPQMEE